MSEWPMDLTNTVVKKTQTKPRSYFVIIATYNHPRNGKMMTTILLDHAEYGRYDAAITLGVFAFHPNRGNLVNGKWVSGPYDPRWCQEFRATVGKSPRKAKYWKFDVLQQTNLSKHQARKFRDIQEEAYQQMGYTLI